jgi:nucleotide-binding universal stress UspA family protein
LILTGKTLVGHAEEIIIETAKDWGADLIVLGSHGYRAIERFLLGSVSQAVASHAPCSVEIVRKAPRQEAQ